jgi:hypothetical protein
VADGTLTSLGQYLTLGISSNVTTVAPSASAPETSMDFTLAWG